MMPIISLLLLHAHLLQWHCEHLEGGCLLYWLHWIIHEQVSRLVHFRQGELSPGADFQGVEVALVVVDVLLPQVALQQGCDLGTVDGGEGFGQELTQPHELIEPQWLVDVDDGADGQQALVTDAAGGSLEHPGLSDYAVEGVDDLIVDQSLLAAPDDHVHTNAFPLPRPDGGPLPHLRDQFLLGTKHLLLQLVLQVADADDQSLRTRLDLGLGHLSRQGGREVGGQRVKQPHYIIDSYQVGVEMRATQHRQSSGGGGPSDKQRGVKARGE